MTPIAGVSEIIFRLVLKGQFAGLRKYRIGDYRVIYAILGDDVLVLRIGHRKDVYKKEI